MIHSVSNSFHRFNGWIVRRSAIRSRAAFTRIISPCRYVFQAVSAASGFIPSRWYVFILPVKGEALRSCCRSGQVLVVRSLFVFLGSSLVRLQFLAVPSLFVSLASIGISRASLWLRLHFLGVRSEFDGVQGVSPASGKVCRVHTLRNLPARISGGASVLCSLGFLLGKTIPWGYMGRCVFNRVDDLTNSGL